VYHYTQLKPLTSYPLLLRPLFPTPYVLPAAAVPAGFARIGPCVCVEIKPKAGFMPGAGSAVAADSIKRRLPRFTMHQLLKHLKVCLHI
jgi:hypothetical protein